MRCLQKMLGLGLCLVAATGWSGSADAQLVWEQTSWSSEHPFTETMVRVEFKCKNIGDYPIRIKQLIGDDRGARPGRAGYAIQPGQSGSATFIVDTKQLFRGESYSVGAMTNDLSSRSQLLSIAVAPEGWSRMDEQQRSEYTRMCEEILANEPVPVVFSKRIVSVRDLNEATNTATIEAKAAEGVRFGMAVLEAGEQEAGEQAAERIPAVREKSADATIIESDPGKHYQIAIRPVSDQAVAAYPRTIDLSIDLPERQLRRQYMEGGMRVVWGGDPVARMLGLSARRLQNANSVDTNPSDASSG